MSAPARVPRISDSNRRRWANFTDSEKAEIRQKISDGHRRRREIVEAALAGEKAAETLRDAVEKSKAPPLAMPRIDRIAEAIRTEIAALEAQRQQAEDGIAGLRAALAALLGAGVPAPKPVNRLEAPPAAPAPKRGSRLTRNPDPPIRTNIDRPAARKPLGVDPEITCASCGGKGTRVCNLCSGFTCDACWQQHVSEHNHHRERRAS